MKAKFTFPVKNILALLFSAILVTTTFFSASATNWIVGADNYVFTPDSFTAVVGDTVTWHFVGGVIHEPASTTIPAGAATWSHDISSGQPDFSYVITVAGTYNYKCNFHFSEGMIGKFIAVNPSTGIQTISKDERAILVYPQPWKKDLTIDLNRNGSFKNEVTVELFNIIGELKYHLVSTEILSSPLTIDLSNLDPGIYLLSLSEGTRKKTIRLIKSE